MIDVRFLHKVWADVDDDMWNWCVVIQDMDGREAVTSRGRCKTESEATRRADAHMQTDKELRS